MRECGVAEGPMAKSRTPVTVGSNNNADGSKWNATDGHIGAYCQGDFPYADGMDTVRLEANRKWGAFWLTKMRTVIEGAQHRQLRPAILFWGSGCCSVVFNTTWGPYGVAPQHHRRRLRLLAAAARIVDGSPLY